METQEKINAAFALLNKELEASKKARLRSLIVGGVIFDIVFIAFMVLFINVKKAFSPQAIAETGTYTIRQLVKEARPVAEKAFKENVPVFLKNLRMQLVRDVVPLLRKHLQRELEKVIENAFFSSSRAFTEAVRAAVERVRTQKQGTPPPEALAALIMQEFERETEKRYSERPEETLGAQFEQSKVMLEGLNRKLELLAGKRKPTSREEALELRFIRAWVSLLTHGERIEEGRPEITAPEGTGAAQPVPPPTP